MVIKTQKGYMPSIEIMARYIRRFNMGIAICTDPDWDKRKVHVDIWKVVRDEDGRRQESVRKYSPAPESLQVALQCYVDAVVQLSDN